MALAKHRALARPNALSPLALGRRAGSERYGCRFRQRFGASGSPSRAPRIREWSTLSLAVEGCPCRSKAAVDYACVLSGDDALAILMGGHLDTVSFVMDYVEFRIGYSILRAHVGPRVELHNGATAQFPKPGSRDALCRLIDSEVVSAREAEDRMRLEVRTSKEDLLVIDGSTYGYPEFAQLVPADERGRLVVEHMYSW